LKEFGAEMGLEWHFSSLEWHFSSPDGPYGEMDTTNHTVKRGLNISVWRADLWTPNSMFWSCKFGPISRHPTEPEDASYLSPSHILLGRAASWSIQRTNQQFTDTFWCRWSLLIEPKWHKGLIVFEYFFIFWSIMGLNI